MLFYVKKYNILLELFCLLEGGVSLFKNMLGDRFLWKNELLLRLSPCSSISKEAFLSTF